MEWLPIESAPKEIVYRDSIMSSEDYHEYGPYILAYPVAGGVARVRWWQTSDDPERFHNFLGDCGNAYRPTHWMPLPDPPHKEIEPR